MKVLRPAHAQSTRLLALLQGQGVDPTLQTALDGLTRIAASGCRRPIALLFGIGPADGLSIVSAVGVSADEVPAGLRILDETVMGEGTLVVTDAADDARFGPSGLRLGETRIRFYAGTAVVAPGGDRLGVLCVLSSEPGPWTRVEEEILAEVSGQVAVQCGLRGRLQGLVETGQRMSYAMEAARDGIWDWNILTGEVYFSPQWARLLGFESGEVPSRVEFFFTVLHPEDVERVRRVLEEHLAGRSPVKQDEVRLRTKSGEYRWFFDRGKVVEWDTTGKPVRMVGTITDITERKQAEAAVRASERELRLITNRIPGPVSRVDRELRYLFVNDQHQHAFGKPRDMVLGRPMVEVVGPKVFAQAAPHFPTVLAGEPVSFECTFDGVEGSVVHRLVNFVPDRDEDHRVVGFFIVSLDITERRKAEEALRVSHAALRSISQGVLITDPLGLILSANRAFTAITGFDESEVVGTESFHLLTRFADPGAVETMRQARLAGIEFSGQVLDHHKDGSSFWNELTITPVRDEAGRLTHFIWIIRDVTGRRSLEEQLRQAQKMDAIGQLAGGVAHDFNNILAAILGNVELVMADVAPADPSMECLGEIRASTLRGKSLVQQILAFSRQQPQQRQVLSLGPVVHEGARLMRATLPAGVQITTSIDPATPNVLASSTQIHQVVVNLCTNAWHALENQPGRIEITLAAVTIEPGSASCPAGLRPGRFARLSVRDTGKGMDELTLQRIFDPFFTTKEPGRGTGLGLSVVHGIVESHDGAITVTSQPGLGSTFHVLLPMASSSGPTVPDAPTPWKRGEGVRVLYVDDEEALVKLTFRMLQRLGYGIQAFTDPDQAVRAFKETPGGFDIVITDMNMPGTSGLQVARAIQQLKPGTPVVLCSGRVTDELRQQAVGAGVVGILHKPNSIDELTDLIHRIMPRPCNA